MGMSTSADLPRCLVVADTVVLTGTSLLPRPDPSAADHTETP